MKPLAGSQVASVLEQGVHVVALFPAGAQDPEPD